MLSLIEFETGSHKHTGGRLQNCNALPRGGACALGDTGDQKKHKVTDKFLYEILF